MFVHTHPIGANYFSALDRQTLKAFAGIVYPAVMGMQVVTESEILTSYGSMENLEQFHIRKKADPDAIRSFQSVEYDTIGSADIFQANQNLYKQIRSLTYRSGIRMTAMSILDRFRKKRNNYAERTIDATAEKMKERGFLKEEDF